MESPTAPPVSSAADEGFDRREFATLTIELATKEWPVGAGLARLLRHASDRPPRPGARFRVPRCFYAQPPAVSAWAERRSVEVISCCEARPTLLPQWELGGAQVRLAPAGVLVRRQSASLRGAEPGVVAVAKY
jgi:hypothetical protein